MLQTLKMSMELTDVLIDIERTGIQIDVEVLKRIEVQFREELVTLEKDIQAVVYRAMGDTPINLASPDDRSLLVYSRKISDKSKWKQIFNIGYEIRGNTKKEKRRPKIANNTFIKHIKELAPAQAKTRGSQCTACKGQGRYSFTTKSGAESKQKRICKNCDGNGIVYINMGGAAGLKVSPRGPQDVCAAGFKTDQYTLAERLPQLTGDAKEFVEKYVRFSKIRTYLNTFVDGINRELDGNNLIHPQFMQCVTSTGRLSSRSPNFQNMPRGGTFPVREAIVSRWDGGYILEGDYRQLEFRVAGFLSGDEQIYEDVRNGVDVHSYTADVMGVSRQEAKAHTFKPLYGGVLGTPQEMKYYSAFKSKYAGIADWHQQLQKEAVGTKRVVLPSGREYAFPNAEFTRAGSVTNSTAVKNYPVQGFATADLLPLALIRLSNSLRKIESLFSAIINTVHDSIVMDVHPSEKTRMVSLLKNSMLSIRQGAKERFGIDYDMPIDIELKLGYDWLNLEELNLNEY